MSRLISFAVLIAIIIIIGLLFYKVLIGFFIPVFLAAVLVVVFRPLHRWVLEKTGQRAQLSAVITTVLIMFVLLIPVLLVGGAAATQGLRLIKNNDPTTIRLRLEKLRNSLGLQMPPFEEELRDVELEISRVVSSTVEDAPPGEESPTLILLGTATGKLLDRLKQRVQIIDGEEHDEAIDELIDLSKTIGTASEDPFAATDRAVQLKTGFEKLKTELLGGSLMAIARERANPTSEDIAAWTDSLVSFARPRLLTLTGATGTFVVKLIFGCVILTVTTFFFLYDGPAMTKTIMRLSPLDDAYEQELLLEFDRVSRAVVLATLFSAIVQGLTAGLGYFVAGMGNLSLLIMLTTIFAMVPFVGPAVIWVPVCLYIGMYEERILPAVLLAAWGVLVVGTVDNLVKALVLHGQSQLHPLLALLSVLGGVQALGPIGIVVGPMVVAMLQTLLSILQRELMHFDKQKLVVSTEGVAINPVDQGGTSGKQGETLSTTGSDAGDTNDEPQPDMKASDSSESENSGGKRSRRSKRRGKGRGKDDVKGSSDA